MRSRVRLHQGFPFQNKNRRQVSAAIVALEISSNQVRLLDFQNPPVQASSLEEVLRLGDIKGRRVALTAPLLGHVSCQSGLEQVTLEAIKERAENYLPYAVSEAVFCWEKLADHKAVVVAIPEDTLKVLTDCLLAHAPEKIWIVPWELCAPKLGRAVFRQDCSHHQIVLSSASDFLCIAQAIPGSLDFVEFALKHWKGPPPKHIIGGTPQTEERTGIPSLPLSNSALAQALLQIQDERQLVKLHGF